MTNGDLPKTYSSFPQKSENDWTTARFMRIPPRLATVVHSFLETTSALLRSTTTRELETAAWLFRLEIILGAPRSPAIVF